MVREAALREDYDDETGPTLVPADPGTWMSFAETGLKLEELPQPTTWRVLVFPKQAKQVSKGGIILAMETKDAEDHLNYIGQVVGLGPLAGKHEKFKNPQWTGQMREYCWDIKVGDWVTYGRYAGQKMEFKGQRFLIVNDDMITLKLDGPEGFKVWV